MATSFSTTQVKTLFDSIAQQAVNIRDSGFGANATGYANNRQSIIDVLTSSNLGPAATLATAFKDDPPVTIATLFAQRKGALEVDLVGINTYLTANDIRVDYSLNSVLGWAINPANVFPPALASAFFGSYTMSGAGAGTYTPGSALDKTKYGKCWLRVKVVGQTWATGATLTIVGTKWDGTSQSKTVSPTDTSVIGTFFNVGTLGTTGDNFATVTSVTATGGASGDSVQIEGRLERVIAL